VVLSSVLHENLLSDQRQNQKSGLRPNLIQLGNYKMQKLQTLSSNR